MGNFESPEHKTLKILAYRRLNVMGYVPYKETTLQFGGAIDVCGLNGKRGTNKKIGVECLTNPTKELIKQKYLDYKDYFDILIFSFYKNTNFTLVNYTKKLDKKVRVWLNKESLLVEKDSQIEEIFCKGCEKTFFVSIGYNFCPYCGGKTFEIIPFSGEVLKNNKNVSYLKSRKSSPFIILKNPNYIKVRGRCK